MVNLKMESSLKNKTKKKDFKFVYAHKAFCTNKNYAEERVTLSDGGKLSAS
jgi:hypothetical protein